MTFEAIKPSKLTDSIVAHVERLILEGVLKPGDRLPPERELAQRLNVSRPSLREALLKLESRGLLQSRRGGGTYVVDIIAPIITDPLVHLLKNHPETRYDIFELRHALEEVAAYFAAIRGTDADHKILQHRLETLVAVHKEENDPFRDADADAEFHLTIAEASHNVALIHVMRGLFNLLRGSISNSLEMIYRHEGNYEIVYGHHKAIFDAILARNPNAAREAVNVHLSFAATVVREVAQLGIREERSQRRLQHLYDTDSDLLS